MSIVHHLFAAGVGMHACVVGMHACVVGMHACVVGMHACVVHAGHLLGMCSTFAVTRRCGAGVYS